MRNPFKRFDIFRCKYHSHARFDYRVSPYHVLRVKNCYPDGCLYFKWRCDLLNKGQTCLKGFKHVGRKCFGCKHYYDEKVNHHPELLVSQDEYLAFLEEIEELEDWLDSKSGKSVEFWGVVKTVKPRLLKEINADKSSIYLDGYLLHFDDVYLDNLHWEDHCYVRIYADQQERFKFAPGDDVEFSCRVEMDQGRLVFNKIRRIEFRSKSPKEFWTNSKALVAKNTMKFLPEQMQKCIHCPSGVLIDVIDKSSPKWVRKRELYCLKSIENPDICPYVTEYAVDLFSEKCP